MDQSADAKDDYDDNDNLKESSFAIDLDGWLRHLPFRLMYTCMRAYQLL